PSGTSDLPALPTSSPAPMHPFPQNGSVGANCTKTAGIAVEGKFLASAYAQWKANFVVSSGSGFRVQRPENSNDTVSEGIGYGMLISAYMGDKTLFDGLWTYWKGNCASGSGNTCLMTWKIPGGSGSATDADEDAAFALLMASKQWPSGSYGADATAMMGAVM